MKDAFEEGLKILDEASVHPCVTADIEDMKSDIRELASALSGLIEQINTRNTFLREVFLQIKVAIAAVALSKVVAKGRLKK